MAAGPDRRGHRGHHLHRPRRVVVPRPLRDHGRTGRRGHRAAAPAGIIQSIYRQSLSSLLRSVLVNVPLAVLLTAVAVKLVQLGLSLTDAMSNAVAHGAGPRHRALHVLGPGRPVGNGCRHRPAVSSGVRALPRRPWPSWSGPCGLGGAPHPGRRRLRGRPLSTLGTGQPGLAGHRPLVPSAGRHAGGADPGEVRDRLGPEPGRRRPGRRYRIDAEWLRHRRPPPSGRWGVHRRTGGAALLLLSAFAPWALFRLLPFVEAGAVGHLEGLSHQARHSVSAPDPQSGPHGHAEGLGRCRGIGRDGDGWWCSGRSAGRRPWPWRWRWRRRRWRQWLRVFGGRRS